MATGLDLVTTQTHLVVTSSYEMDFGNAVSDEGLIMSATTTTKNSTKQLKIHSGKMVFCGFFSSSKTYPQTDTQLKNLLMKN